MNIFEVIGLLVIVAGMKNLIKMLCVLTCVALIVWTRMPKKYIDADWLKWVSDIVIEYAPAAEVVEVVRCKDCKYNYDGNCDAIYHILDGDLIGVTLQCYDDFFCANGERRDDDVER